MENKDKLILPFDDFDPNVEELEDECEEHQDEIKKDLEGKLKLADEINGDEHTKAIPVEPKMPKNEKLILEEPDYNLNENFINESPTDTLAFYRDIYDSLEDIMYKYREDGITRGDLTDAIRWFMSRFSYDGYDDYDESLNEALPKDLAKVYRKADNVVGGTRWSTGYDSYNNINRKRVRYDERPTIDFEKSTYDEITPDEARAIRKAGDAKNLRVIFDGQLVTFDEKGYQRDGYYSAENRGYRKQNDRYRKTKTGKYASKSNGLSFDEVVDRADKIYLVNEVDIDPTLIDQRKQNPESIYGPRNMSRPEIFTTKDKWYELGGDRGGSKPSYYEWDKYDDEKLRYYEDKIKAGEILSGYDVESYDRLLQKYKKWKWRNRDYDARVRYLSSERELGEPIDNLVTFRNNLEDAKTSLANARVKADNFKQNGNPDIPVIKEKLAKKAKELRELMQYIAEYELELQDAQDNYDIDLQKLEDNIINKQAQVDSLQSDIDALLRKN